MAKTPEQILSNYGQHAERSRLAFDSATGSSNSDLAASNMGQGLTAYLMQGLVGWRRGILSPLLPFCEALSFVRLGYSTLQAMNGSRVSLSFHIPLEKLLFIGYLTNEDALTFEVHDLVADRLLDAQLGRGLKGAWSDEAWAAALEELRRIKGSALAVETYVTYHRLLHSSKNEIGAVVEKAVSLFEVRKSNPFYGSGEQTNGGGMYNSLTVDFRLAAIVKKLGHKDNSVHAWQWG